MSCRVDSLNINPNPKQLALVSKPEINGKIEVFANENSGANVDEINIQPANSTEALSSKADKKKKLFIGIGIGITVVTGLAILAYCKRGSIKKLFDNTKLGKSIRENLEKAKLAKNTPLETISSHDNNFIDEVANRLIDEGEQIAKKFDDVNFSEKMSQYSIEQVNNNPNIIRDLDSIESSAELIKSTIELSGTGPIKIAQIISNDVDIMTKLDDKCPSLALALRKTKTECNPGRTFDEAIDFLKESFPDSGYKLQKELGVGSIGATYLAQTPTGENVAIKMIKKGVSLESINSEKDLLLDTVSKVCHDNEFKKAKTIINELYNSWIEELNLAKSLEYNRQLSAGATRYSVAQVKEISKNGQCIVMEMAKGIQMNKLINVLNDYKANPTEYVVKYADLIKTNPWMSNPQKVLEELPRSLTEAFSEQFLFMKKGNISIMHGDPHTGNFFITMNDKGKLVPQFIDTDNCVVRNCVQIKDDLSMLANYLVGNPKKIAEYYVNQCDFAMADKSKYIELISKELKMHIFNGKNNITNYAQVQKNISAILKKYGLKISLKNTTALKAQLEFIKVIGETNRLSGKKMDVLSLMKDIPRSVWDMIRTGANPLDCIKDALIYAFKNSKEAMINSGQFFV